MSGKSKRAVARIKQNIRRPAPRLDRPFDPAVWSRAAAIADQYRLILEPDPDAGFVGTALELPNVFADGKTPDECVRETRVALTGVVARMMERGQAPPSPADEQRREQQINIRVTDAEKSLLEQAARSKGFRGISDF